jgi:hypothetical protein
MLVCLNFRPQAALAGDSEPMETTQIVVLNRLFLMKRRLIDGFADGTILANSIIDQKTGVFP